MLLSKFAAFNSGQSFFCILCCHLIKLSVSNAWITEHKQKSSVRITGRPAGFLTLLVWCCEYEVVHHVPPQVLVSPSHSDYFQKAVSQSELKGVVYAEAKRNPSELPWGEWRGGVCILSYKLACAGSEQNFNHHPHCPAPLFLQSVSLGVWNTPHRSWSVIDSGVAVSLLSEGSGLHLGRSVMYN